MLAIVPGDVHAGNFVTHGAGCAKRCAALDFGRAVCAHANATPRSELEAGADVGAAALLSAVPVHLPPEHAALHAAQIARIRGRPDAGAVHAHACPKETHRLIVAACERGDMVAVIEAAQGAQTHAPPPPPLPDPVPPVPSISQPDAPQLLEHGQAERGDTPSGMPVVGRSHDMWGFGVLLYEMCAGAALFRADVRGRVADEAELGRIALWSDADVVRALAPLKDHGKAPLHTTGAHGGRHLKWPTDLLARLLHPTPSKRPCSWAEVTASLGEFDFDDADADEDTGTGLGTDPPVRQGSGADAGTPTALAPAGVGVTSVAIANQCASAAEPKLVPGAQEGGVVVGPSANANAGDEQGTKVPVMLEVVEGPALGGVHSAAAAAETDAVCLGDGSKVAPGTGGMAGVQQTVAPEDHGAASTGASGAGGVSLPVLSIDVGKSLRPGQQRRVLDPSGGVAPSASVDVGTGVGPNEDADVLLATCPMATVAKGDQGAQAQATQAAAQPAQAAAQAEHGEHAGRIQTLIQARVGCRHTWQELRDNPTGKRGLLDMALQALIKQEATLMHELRGFENRFGHPYAVDGAVDSAPDYLTALSAEIEARPHELAEAGDSFLSRGLSKIAAKRALPRHRDPGSK